jgi:hypothetical protein
LPLGFFVFFVLFFSVAACVSSGWAGISSIRGGRLSRNCPSLTPESGRELWLFYGFSELGASL